MSSKKEEGKPYDLTSQMYKLVLERRTGVLQSTVWKELGLTSRDGSRIAIRLEKRGMIKRERVLEQGRWTYSLSPLRFPIQFGPIEHIPCTTCFYETQCLPDGIVSPMNCPPEREGKGIADWVIREHGVVMAKSSKQGSSTKSSHG